VLERLPRASPLLFPRWAAILIAGALASAVTFLAGYAIEGSLRGWSERAVLDTVEHEVRQTIGAISTSLESIAAAVVRQPQLPRLFEGDAGAARVIFQQIEQAISAQPEGDIGVTVYNASGAPVAWGGRPSDLPSFLAADRVSESGSLFVAPGPLGLRLIYLEPISGRTKNSTASSRLGIFAAERVISPARAVEASTSSNYELETSIVPVALRTRYEGAGSGPAPNSFAIRSPSGELLFEASVPAHQLQQLRTDYRRDLFGLTLAVLAVTVLLLAGPLLDFRGRQRAVRGHVKATMLVVLVLIAGRALLWLATPARWTGGLLFSPGTYASSIIGPLLRTPIDFVFTGLLVLAVVGIAGDSVQRMRCTLGRRRFVRAASGVAVIHLLAGLAAGACLVAYELFLADTVDNTSIDILHFSLLPWDPGRIALAVGLLGFHAAAFWAMVTAFVAARSQARIRLAPPFNHLAPAALWMTAAVVLLTVANRRNLSVPAGPTILVVALAAIVGSTARRWLAWFRHSAQATRIVTLFLGLLLPAVAMYPSVLHFAESAKRRLVETQYAVQAAAHPEELIAKLRASLSEIDRIPGLAETLMSLEPTAPGAPQTDSAFFVWRQTDLAQFRLTSAVELYGMKGSLLSRFALNFPEYTPSELRHLIGNVGPGSADQEPAAGARPRAVAAPGPETAALARCEWDLFGEASPFGSEERRMLHAERGVCENGRPVGAVVVHVMLDYDTLPFISSQSPYFEFFRDTGLPPQEGTPGRDVELAIYGWGRLPIYTSGTGAWPLDQNLFTRVQSSRQAFWTDLFRDGTRFHVYIANDRYGIYALGYPAVGWFDHCVHLAELAVLAGLVFVTLVLCGALFSRVARRRGGSAHRLLREIRESFYRKLFLAFVFAAVVPVAILSVAVRAYAARLIQIDISAQAARTAAVAQRVIEESAAVQQRGAESLMALSDDVMVATSKLIDEDVNLFAGPRLVSTSERDLFASGLLPTRTPAAVYRGIVLEHLPNLVTVDQIGGFSYLLSAAPLRVGGREAIVTVPLALRQQQVDRDLDELDRGLYVAALGFILLGAGIGLWMAQRIADPVSRLTRATRRIAQGDLDARIVVKSADELQRLVEAFNRMAGDLKAQRLQLERTHRLEAWAEMARQVAHEIKNPLTPIQLSAEHLRRVHADRGRPLTPVVEGCVDTILTQVQLLRQIAAEFSSFASSPSARPSVSSIGALVAEIIEPYRTGLSGRIDIEVHVEPELPAIFVDRVLVGRALTNIIENALYAMPGRGSLRIAATSAPEDDEVVVTISDTGVGMDDDARARLFEPYFSTKASGTGLGLTIAKRNLELNGGRIEIESVKGRGTTVVVRLPAYHEAEGGIEIAES
jgi:signal transduction histidine kinase